MKTLRILILVIFGLFTQNQIQAAAKVAFVDTDYILSQMPEYLTAQKKLNTIAEEWQKEATKKQAEIKKFYREYQAEELILTEQQKKIRQNQIVKKEEELRTFQNDKFGYEGALFKKRQELIKPIQDKVFNAVQIISKKNAFDIVIDKASGNALLFANPKYDISGEVLEELGVASKQIEEED